MSKWRTAALWAGIAAVLGSGVPAAAQSSLHVGAGRATLTAGDYEGVDAGWAFSGRWMTDVAGFRSGLGVTYLRVQADDLEDPITQLDGLIHYRSEIGDAGPRPVLGAALGFSMQQFVAPDEGGLTQTTFTSWGGTLGVEAGVAVPVGGRLSVEALLDARAMWMGSFKSGDLEVSGSSSNGLRIGGSVGMAFAIGR